MLTLTPETLDIIEQSGQMVGLNSTLVNTLTGDDFAQEIHLISSNEYVLTGFSSAGFNGAQKFNISQDGVGNLIERASFNELTELPNTYYEFNNSISDQEGNVFIQLTDSNDDKVFVIKYDSHLNSLSTVVDYELQEGFNISEGALGINGDNILVALDTNNQNTNTNRTNSLILEQNINSDVISSCPPLPLRSRIVTTPLLTSSSPTITAIFAPLLSAAFI